MSSIRYVLEGVLTVVTPLHVGTGEFREVDGVKGDDGRNEIPLVAAIARDALDRPYLPATTLKGLLRRLAETFVPTATKGNPRDSATDRLLGRIKTSDGSGRRAQTSAAGGRMGALLLRGGEFLSPGACEGAPFVPDHDAKLFSAGGLGAGVFVASRTRIDAESGTAQHSALFHQEVVAAGAQFRFGALIELRTEDAEVIDLLKQVLARLSDAEGQSIGKGQADGAGRVRLEAARSTLTRMVLGPSGEYVAETARRLDAELAEIATARRKPEREERMTLRCPGPFVVVDASRRPKRRPGLSVGGNTPQLRSQEIASQPLVLGAGIAGALRARARWLEGRRRLRQDKTLDPGALDGPVSVRDAAGAKALDAVQRLFGVTGFRGLVGIEVGAVETAGPWDVTSVRLDRLSGAPIDGALFTTRGFIGVTIALTLRLEGRGATAPTETDLALFDSLVADIRANGLQLGHGVNKGFGWFTTGEKL